MKKSLELYRCKLVKESTIEYIGNIKSSDDAVNAARRIGFSEASEEYFGMFSLNVKGEIVAYHEISHGDLCSSSAHPREIFKRALLNNSGAIIFIHNHPSGDATPSTEDILATEKFVEGGEILGIKVLDHIIMGLGGKHFSMRAEGIL